MATIKIKVYFDQETNVAKSIGLNYRGVDYCAHDCRWHLPWSDHVTIVLGKGSRNDSRLSTFEQMEQLVGYGDYKAEEIEAEVTLDDYNEHMLSYVQVKHPRLSELDWTHF